ncbi:hypothetical protein JXQ70_16065 [bacterium]|nr:hypothetical protein [bacterium]
MSIFDDWKKRRIDRKIEKYGQYLSLKTSSRDGRWQAMEFLRDSGSSEAISALLQRFRLTIPELTQDEEEKDFVCTIISEKGVIAKKPLLQYISKYDEIMKPLVLLAQILGPDEMVVYLVNQIKDVGELFSSMKTIKVVEILRHLALYQSACLVDLGLSIITSFDDDEVILAGLEVLEKQADERSRQTMLELAAAPETTLRITFRIGDIIEKLGWSIKGVTDRKQLEVKLRDEFYTVKGGYLKRKNIQKYG